MTRDYQICGDPNRRHDFVFLFDVTDGNPNGDPDAGNMPRLDPETMNGIVTDVCIKRKIRNYVQQYTDQLTESHNLEIYVQEKGIALNTLHKKAYDTEGIKPTGNKQKAEEIAQVRDRMCKTYFDVRIFGAVMGTGTNCGQVRGPLQLTFSRSVDPILPLDVGITRVAVTREEDAAVVVTESNDGDQGTGGKRTEMGRKAILPYGLYIGKGFFSPAFAKKTGVSREDLTLVWDAFQNMWDLDRSASRGLMALRGLYVFSHNRSIGSAPAHTLFNLVQVHRNEDVEVARAFSHYHVDVQNPTDDSEVILTRLVG